MKVQYRAQIIAIVFIGCIAFTPVTIGQTVYTGKVTFIQFNDDGSFIFQLDNKTPINVKDPRCTIRDTFLAKKRHGKVKNRKLARMKSDIKKVYLADSETLKISVSVFDCDESGYPMVDNIMLGNRRD